MPRINFSIFSHSSNALRSLLSPIRARFFHALAIPGMLFLSLGVASADLSEYTILFEGNGDDIYEPVGVVIAPDHRIVSAFETGGLFSMNEDGTGRRRHYTTDLGQRPTGD
jgi:hypothetical protein